MATSQTSEPSQAESADSASRAATNCDTTSTEGEWEDETGDDDMDFEPTTDGSEDAEFFDPTEDVEADFHGIVSNCWESASLCVLVCSLLI